MNHTALALAKEHMKKMNPSGWDGNGQQPEDFNPIICTYPIDDTSELDISFERDREEWVHLCELRDNEDETLLEIQSGNSICSANALAVTIAAVCAGRI